MAKRPPDEQPPQTDFPTTGQEEPLDGGRKNGLSLDASPRNRDDDDLRFTHDQSQEDEKADGDGSGSQTMVFSCPVDHEGTAVYVKGWVQPGSTKPPVVIVHDLGENIGLYRSAAKTLGEAGYSVFGFDLRGHGRSGRMLGHIPKFESLVTDLLQVTNWIRYKSERRVPIVIGQGIGALITVFFQTTYPKLCRGTVLIAPCLSEEAYLSFSKRLLIKSIAEISPTMRLPRWLTPEFLFPYSYRRRSETNVMRQPFHGITANFAYELLQAIKSAPQRFEQLSCPSLIILPKCDEVCDYTQLDGMIARHPRLKLLEVKELQETGHHVLTDGEEDMAAAARAIVDWLSHSQLTGSSATAGGSQAPLDALAIGPKMTTPD